MGLLNDVLDFTKSKAGKIKLNVSATDLDVLFNTYKETWSETAKNKNLGFLVNIESKLPHIARLDELRVNQILNNVVSNAIKFTSDGNITTNVTTLNQANKNTILDIKITDTGIGMTAEELERLFDPFEQADKSTSKRFGGTGLGMAITLDLVELMKGTIKCKSEQGTGSEFHIRIPIEVSNTDENTSTHSQQKRILVVDDIDMNLMVIEGLIEKLGHHASTANSGKSAIDLALSEDFDLILMDIHMPEIDGFEAAQQIRAKKPAQKIIALSADDPQSLPASQTNNHIDGFLLKPMSEQSLAEVIDQQK
jgi:CheY-like chemotaxis protein